jgi:hypothetical protein
LVSHLIPPSTKSAPGNDEGTTYGSIALLHFFLHTLDSQSHLGLDHGQVLLQAGLGHFRGQEAPLPLVDARVARRKDADLAVGQLVVKRALEVFALDAVHFPRGVDVLKAGLGRTDADNWACERDVSKRFRSTFTDTSFAAVEIVRIVTHHISHVDFVPISVYAPLLCYI